MEIGGLQKVTLLDFPSKVACIVFTTGCNFRCPYCQNGSLVLNTGEKELLDLEEIFVYLKKEKEFWMGFVLVVGNLYCKII